MLCVPLVTFALEVLLDDRTPAMLTKLSIKIVIIDNSPDVRSISDGIGAYPSPYDC